MLEMIAKINRGFTYQDVTDKTHVPISTLWTSYLKYFLAVHKMNSLAQGLFNKEWAWYVLVNDKF